MVNDVKLRNIVILYVSQSMTPSFILDNKIGILVIIYLEIIIEIIMYLRFLAAVKII